MYWTEPSSLVHVHNACQLCSRSHFTTEQNPSQGNVCLLYLEKAVLKVVSESAQIGMLESDLKKGTEKKLVINILITFIPYTVYKISRTLLLGSLEGFLT